MVWYDETAIANIFGLLELKKNHRITFDGCGEGRCLHSPYGQREHEGQVQPRSFEVSNRYLKKESHLINTVKENRVGYTQRQFEQAKRAQELYHIV
jgi:predicted DNA-binding WGR domain protein